MVSTIVVHFWDTSCQNESGHNPADSVLGSLSPAFLRNTSKPFFVPATVVLILLVQAAKEVGALNWSFFSCALSAHSRTLASVGDVISARISSNHADNPPHDPIEVDMELPDPIAKVGRFCIMWEAVSGGLFQGGEFCVVPQCPTQMFAAPRLQSA